MKKILFSFLCCLLAVIGVQAQTKTYTYDFSDYTNFSTDADGNNTVATSSSNKLNAFYYKETGDEFNANGKGYFNNGYMLFGKSGAYIQLPTYVNEKITSVTATTSSGCSQSVVVAIYSGPTVVVTGVKWEKRQYDYSYTIPNEYQTESLKLQVTSSHNAQITKLVIVTESAVDPTTPALTVSNIDFGTFMSGEAVSQAVNLTASNFAGDVTYSYSITAGQDNFAVDASGNVSVTATTFGTYEGELTVVATDGTNTVTSTAALSAVVREYLDVEEGRYAIKYDLDGTTYLMKNEVYSNYYVTGTEFDLTSGTPTSEYIFTIEKVEGGYTIQNNEATYVNIIQSGSYYNLKPAENDAAVWTFYKAADGAVEAYCENVSVEYYMAFKLYNNTTPEFLAANSGEQYPTLVYIGDVEEIVTPPTFNPAAGAVVMGTEVTITADEGATIMYSTDGGANYTEYTAPIVVNEEMTIMAYAVVGGTNSAVVESAYTIAQLAAPTFNPAAGAVVMGAEVTITADEGATIMYSTDGGANYTEYTALIVVNEEMTIMAYAVMEGYLDSEVASAQYTLLAPAEAGDFVLVTDASTLAVGDKIVIVAADYNYALSTTQNGNNRSAAVVTKNTDNNTVTFGDDVQVIYLQNGSVDGTFAFYVPGSVNTTDTYLYAASNSSNHLKTTNEVDGKASWTITIADGKTSIVASENSRNHMRYNENSGNPIFSCYAETSTMKDVVVYRMQRYEEKIVSNMTYGVAVGSAWEEPEGCWYAAKFVNRNTDAYTWAAVCTTIAIENGHGYRFYLSAGNTPITRAKAENDGYTYTHVEFVQLPSTYTCPDNIQEIDLTGVTYETTGEVYYDGTASTTYDIATATWKDVATGIDQVEAVEGIAYVGGIVEAEGTIEVYNMSGVVVARGNDNIDLRGLNAGVYVVRCGDAVRKVVR